MKRTIITAAAAAALALQASSAKDISKAKLEFFESKVRPILAQHCYSCHGPDERERKGDLRLDVKADAYADRLNSIYQIIYCSLWAAMEAYRKRICI